MSAAPQLFDLPPVGPPGFAYRAELVSPEEEAELLARLAELPFEPFLFQGFEGRRRVCSFGHRYDFNGPGLVDAPPIPDWLLPIRARAAAFAGLPPEAFAHLLINEYREGAPIGWHRDRPVFAEVVGLSLLAPCTFRMRRRTPDGFERAALTVEPRSAYLLSGPARSEWEHSIPPVEALRYSITFRNFRGERAPH